MCVYIHVYITYMCIYICIYVYIHAQLLSELSRAACMCTSVYDEYRPRDAFVLFLDDFFIQYLASWLFTTRAAHSLLEPNLIL